MELKNIYTYLEEIDFEKRVKEKAEYLRKATKSTNPMLSDMSLCQFVFGIVQDFYGKILDDYYAEQITHDNNHIADVSNMAEHKE